MRHSVDEMGCKIGAVYKKNKNPFYENLFFGAVSARGAPLYEAGTPEVKEMVKYAADGNVIGILCDQKYRRGELIPFMGLNAWTSPAVAGIANKVGVPLFVLMCRRDGDEIVAHYHEPIEPRDQRDMMIEVHQIMENWIRETPEQWYWFHNRWDKVPADQLHPSD